MNYKFAKIYIFNLRGNAYLQGEDRRKEAGNVFDSGSRLPVAVTLLIKKEKHPSKPGEIFYYEVGDYLNREEKLNLIARENSFGSMLAAGNLQKITPNESGDWINQRSEIFKTFMRLGNKKETENFAIFDERYSTGLTTGRDAWCYNFSKEALKKNMASMIEIYNQERERWNKKGNGESIRDFVTSDTRKIS